MKDFRNLDVWKFSHELTLASYRATQTFPKDELFGLRSQIRRAASSIPTNIAEGCGRHGNAEFHRFLQIATGSASELEYEFLLSHDLGLFADPVYSELAAQVTRVKRMLSGLMKKVESERLST